MNGAQIIRTIRVLEAQIADMQKQIDLIAGTLADITEPKPKRPYTRRTPNAVTAPEQTWQNSQTEN